MSDLDIVLERLLTDAGFATALAHDPSRALVGYSLSEEDLSLLATQVSLGSGADSRVEERISKAGTFGLLSSIAGGLGLGGMAAGMETVTSGPGDEVGIILQNSDPSGGGGVGDPGGSVGAFEGYLPDPSTAPGDEAGIIIVDGAVDPSTAPGDEAGIIIINSTGDPSTGPGDEAGIILQNPDPSTPSGPGDEAGIILQNPGPPSR